MDIRRAVEPAFEQLSAPLKELGFNPDFVAFNECGNPSVSKYMVLKMRFADPNRWGKNEVTKTLEIAPPQPEATL
jgi:hypothetical protein